MNAIQKKSGQYLGTRIEHKWWRHYTKGGFFTRGIGEYWVKDGSLFFQQRSRQKPIKLPLHDIVEVSLCPCTRRLKVGPVPIIKLIWQKDGRWLSSIFALPESFGDANGLIASLRAVT
jgi:hypothetical protein